MVLLITVIWIVHLHHTHKATSLDDGLSRVNSVLLHRLVASDLVIYLVLEHDCATLFAECDRDARLKVSFILILMSMIMTVPMAMLLLVISESPNVPGIL